MLMQQVEKFVMRGNNLHKPLGNKQKITLQRGDKVYNGEKIFDTWDVSQIDLIFDTRKVRQRAKLWPHIHHGSILYRLCWMVPGMQKAYC